MKTSYVCASGFALFTLAVTALTRQEPGKVADKTELDRLGVLESRVDRLEKILFATSKITVLEAERRLKEAEHQARDSREMFLKGVMAESKWLQDQFQVDILRRELELSRATSQQRQTVMQIELLQAEKDLQLAQDQLHYSKNLATRGFSSIDQIRQAERMVSDATERLEFAKQKLKAAEELESIVPKTKDFPSP